MSMSRQWVLVGLPFSEEIVNVYPTHIDSISADIKLETENEEGLCGEDAPAYLSDSVYHPRVALKNAINDWLPEFFISKEAWGPITKPHPAVASKHTYPNTIVFRVYILRLVWYFLCATGLQW